MSNKDKLIQAITEWLGNVAASALPKINIPPTSSIGRMMSGFFGINPARYNVWDELGFLLLPTIQSFVEPKLRQLLADIPEEKVKEMAMNYGNAFLARAQEKGSINMLGIELGKNAFEGLKDILDKKFNT